MTRRGCYQASVLFVGLATSTPVVAQTPLADEHVKLTIHELEALGVALEAYIVDYSGLPVDASLQELYEGAAATPTLGEYLAEFYRVDAWNSPWQYRPDLSNTNVAHNWPSPGYSRDLTTSFTIASAGPDRHFGTPDDIVVRDGEVVAIPAGVEWQDILSPEAANRETERRAVRIQVALRRVRENASAWPADLSELANADLPAELRNDIWGHSFRYVPTEQGFALTSAGADGTFGTRDDLRVVYPPRS